MAQKWRAASEEAADSRTARSHLARYDRICRALTHGKAPAEWEAQEV